MNEQAQARNTTDAVHSVMARNRIRRCAKRVSHGALAALLLSSCTGDESTRPPAATALDGSHAEQRAVTLTPVADAHVKARYPDRNYGDQDHLRIRRSSAYNVHLKFSIPSVGVVSSAKLRLYTTNGSRDGGTIFATSPEWSEDSITWSNAPPPTSEELDAVGKVSEGDWIEFDVTSAVSSSSEQAFVITSNSRNSAYYDSKEGTFSPELVLIGAEPHAGCGDGICTNGEESCASCPQDCGPCAACGDGTCSDGEECSTCEEDCGACPTAVCGDGICEGAESCATCDDDCGTCGTTGAFLIAHSDLMKLPLNGDFDDIVDVASDSFPPAGLSDDYATRSSDIHVLAAALVYARTGDKSYGDKAFEQLVDLVSLGVGSGYHSELDTHHVGRNLLGHVAAYWFLHDAAASATYSDPGFLSTLRAFDDNEFRPYLQGLATNDMPGDNRSVPECHQKRPNNWGTMCGLALTAIHYHFQYAGDVSPVDFNNLVTVSRTFAGGSGWNGFDYGDEDWQCDEVMEGGQWVSNTRLYGINPRHCRTDGYDTSSLLPEEMRRSSDDPSSSFPKENYVYTALQGLTMQFELLRLQGVSAWTFGDDALIRAYQKLHDASAWDGGGPFTASGDDTYLIPVANCRLGASYPVASGSLGRTFHFTEWLYSSNSALCQ